MSTSSRSFMAHRIARKVDNGSGFSPSSSNPGSPTLKISSVQTLHLPDLQKMTVRSPQGSLQRSPTAAAKDDLGPGTISPELPPISPMNGTHSPMRSGHTTPSNGTESIALRRLNQQRALLARTSSSDRSLASSSSTSLSDSPVSNQSASYLKVPSSNPQATPVLHVPTITPIMLVTGLEVPVPKGSSRSSPRGSPRASPRTSPRNSPRGSPNVSPRASPRSSPRASPRLSAPPAIAAKLGLIKYHIHFRNGTGYPIRFNIFYLDASSLSIVNTEHMAFPQQVSSVSLSVPQIVIIQCVQAWNRCVLVGPINASTIKISVSTRKGADGLTFKLADSMLAHGSHIAFHSFHHRGCDMYVPQAGDVTSDGKFQAVTVLHREEKASFYDEEVARLMNAGVKN